MVKKGDTVRYLSEVGGGVVVRVDGKIAYVEEDGFERPISVNELVVVLPAGHQPSSGARLMFDQQAFDTGRTSKRNKPEESKGSQSGKDAESLIKEVAPTKVEIEEEFEIVETEYGDSMSVLLAFEPKDLHKLDTTSFNMVLVNDSNFFLSYQLLKRASNAGEWESVKRGEVAPNEIADLCKVEHDDIPSLERLVFQAIAYKKDKSFISKEPLNVLRKIDLTKFFKFHCYRPGLYFDSPVLEIPLLAETLKRKPQSNIKSQPNKI